ncbi:BTB/POZ and MATH domain-containing protein 1-like [Gigantopelta aegis]|uniref:BTB/POZ and MATH domain-containing protein 1-like n=1 Tax=Gigantopelta aegis TaxID=1735272 RepID=UPI001B88AD31|nr:BTB/POZ and MATH domain-containing protein 1-like [Gigantopelta aegis]
MYDNDTNRDSSKYPVHKHTVETTMYDNDTNRDSSKYPVHKHTVEATIYTKIIASSKIIPKLEEESSSKKRMCLYASPDEFTDVVLEVQDHKFYFYRLLLCRASPVFKAMLHSDFKEKDTGTILLHHRPFQDIYDMLRFLDPEVNFIIDIRAAFRLIPVADEFGVTRLRDVCVNYLLQHMDHVSTASDIMNCIFVAERHHHPSLMKAAIGRASRFSSAPYHFHISKLKATEFYQQLQPSTVIELLETKLMDYRSYN